MSKHNGGRIDRLELRNFKSYKKHQVIGPFKRFTAIIGPNGSGKSNLMDAISFVLGVRSQQLRGNVIGDLVYSNDAVDNKTTNPQEGEKVKTYVKLFFQTSKGEELQFQRAITSAGGTQYFLNNRPCTSAQYDAKLNSFGVIVKARNFLVFQGDVESIASKSPKDLTTLFEQISGSDELKQEYEKLEQDKLEAESKCTENFAKRKQMVQEKKVAKAQKEEADKHARLQQELTGIRNEASLFGLFQEEKEMEGFEKQIAKVKAEADGMTEAQSKIELDMVEAKKQRQVAVQATMIAEKKAEKQKAALDTKNPLLVKNKEEIKRGIKRIKNLEANLAAKKQANEGKDQQIAKLEEDLASLKVAEEAYNAEMKEKDQQEGQVMMGEEQLSEYNRRKEEAGAKTYKLKQEREIMEVEQQREKEDKTNAEAKLQDITARIQRLEGAEQGAEEKKKTNEMLLKEEQETVKGLKKTEREINEKVRKARITGDQIQTKLNAVEEKLRAAKADQKESERDRRLKDTVESLKHHFPGVKGRLVDLIQVMERRHNLAVSVALGKNMDAIVVEEETTAKDCIQYLKEQRLQTLTFLPLNTLRVKPIDSHLRHALQGTARLVLDVVQYDASLEHALLYAIGPCIVCDTHKEAKKMCFGGGGERHKVVSLDGTLISKSGVMTGGMTGSMESKAAAFDRQVVEKMKAERQQHMEGLEQLGCPRERQKEADDIKQTIHQVEVSMKMHQAEIEAMDSKMSKLKVEKQNLNTAADKAAPDLKALSSRIQEREIQISKFTKRVNEIADRIFSEFSQQVGVANIREYEETQLRVAQERAEKRMKFTTQAAKLRAQLDYEKHQNTLKPIQDAEQSLKKAQDALKNLQDHHQTLLQSQQEAESEMESVMEEVKGWKAKEEEAEVQLKELKDLLSERTSKLAKTKRALNHAQQQLQQTKLKRLAILRSCDLAAITIPNKDNKAEDSENPTEDVEMEDAPASESAPPDGTGEEDEAQDEERLLSLRPDFNKLPRRLQVHMTAQDRAKTDQELASKVSSLESELERCAPNLRAVEHYAALKERERLFLQELDDTKESARQAGENFHKAKMQRTERFMNCFKHVAQHIDTIYKDLTRKPGQVLGGTAYLNLENQEEPFLHGVKYTAMPPAKRFRDMEQLSGGEKTVAALALLFAVHNFKPSPFFVLDEVDAALDNTNVEKVAHYIMSKSHQEAEDGGFQSVVISLKDMFYDKADALIGVCRDPVDNSSITYSFDLEKFKF